MYSNVDKLVYLLNIYELTCHSYHFGPLLKTGADALMHLERTHVLHKGSYNGPMYGWVCARTVQCMAVPRLRLGRRLGRAGGGGRSRQAIGRTSARRKEGTRRVDTHSTCSQLRTDAASCAEHQQRVAVNRLAHKLIQVLGDACACAHMLP